MRPYLSALQIVSRLGCLAFCCQTARCCETTNTFTACQSRVGTKLCRAAGLQERSLTPLVYTIGSSMTSMVGMDRHLWPNLTENKKKKVAFLLEEPISQSGILDDMLNAVIEKF
ncbi:hypothetical protein H4Q32_029811 [Labeo rohita]|uniref:Secreted protein n=1 Tax=Labeo rohita TaxID=84645 RepID=A0ABQ8M146_LABRO|nr:hypothetical protein H4Q32_029811 [Labeo rohita]